LRLLETTDFFPQSGHLVAMSQLKVCKVIKLKALNPLLTLRTIYVMNLLPSYPKNVILTSMSIEFGIFLYLVIIFSAVFHEFMHGWMASYLGDPTAKHAGRLTLNPLKHIDPMGTVVIPLLLLFFFGGFIGWAKPVPYNPLLLRDKKYGSAKVGFAGPAANFIIAIIFGILLRFISPEAGAGGAFFLAINWVVYINIFLGLFNLIPIPPLDGSKLLMDFYPRSRSLLMQLSIFGIFFALIVAVMILPPVAHGLHWLFTGEAFLGAAF